MGETTAKWLTHCSAVDRDTRGTPPFHFTNKYKPEGGKERKRTLHPSFPTVESASPRLLSTSRQTERRPTISDSGLPLETERDGRHPGALVPDSAFDEKTKKIVLPLVLIRQRTVVVVA